jgi:hypothetical protein
MTRSPLPGWRYCLADCDPTAPKNGSWGKSLPRTSIRARSPPKEPNRQLFTRHIRGGLLLAISLRHLDTAQLPVTMLPLVELQAATTGRSTFVLDEGAPCTSPPTMAKVSIARTAIIIVTNPNRRK